MKNVLKGLWEEEDGQDLTEYALLVALVALASIATMKIFAAAVSDAFSSAAANLVGNTTTTT
jgi:pilus assembly protein Flp/PilA